MAHSILLYIYIYIYYFFELEGEEFNKVRYDIIIKLCLQSHYIVKLKSNNTSFKFQILDVHSHACILLSTSTC